MSGTLFRLGLWVILIDLALYVLKDTFAESPAADLFSADTLTKAAVVGLLLLAAGTVAAFVERATRPIRRSRCTTCGKAVPRGEIYCREHLRRVLELEDTRLRARRP